MTVRIDKGPCSRSRSRDTSDRAGKPDRCHSASRLLKRALEDDAVADEVNDLLFEHVVVGHLHPSVVAENLPSYIAEILDAATREDWRAVADELIAEASEVNGEG